MRTAIWKYQIGTTDTQRVFMPAGAKILTVQVQDGNACLWALVEKDQPLEERVIAIIGTGHDADRVADAEYIGTYQVFGGGLIFHVFEIR